MTNYLLQLISINYSYALLFHQNIPPTETANICKYQGPKEISSGIYTTTY